MNENQGCVTQSRSSFLRLFLEFLRETQCSDNPLLQLHLSGHPGGLFKSAEKWLHDEPIEPGDVGLDWLTISRLNQLVKSLIESEEDIAVFLDNEAMVCKLREYEDQYPHNAAVFMTEVVCRDFLTGQYCLEHGLYKTITSDEDLCKPREVSSAHQARIDRFHTHFQCRFAGDIPINRSLACCWLQTAKQDSCL